MLCIRVSHVCTVYRHHRFIVIRIVIGQNLRLRRCEARCHQLHSSVSNNIVTSEAGTGGEAGDQWSGDHVFSILLVSVGDTHTIIMAGGVIM